MAKPGTREPQYSVSLDYRDKHGQEKLGLMTNQAWYDDPKRLTFTLARYKFVAKMLAGMTDVLEVGCGDAFAHRTDYTTSKKYIFCCHSASKST